MEMRPVRRDEVAALQEVYQEVYVQPPERVGSWLTEETLALSEAWAAFDSGRMASCLLIHPLTVWMGQTHVPMGGIGGVATRAEYRRQGLSAGLLRHALQTMKEQGLVISSLFPFSFPFYRRLGWEVGGETLQYRLPVTALAPWLKYPGEVRRVLPQTDDLRPLEASYNQAAQSRNLGVVRPTKDWRKLFFGFDKDESNVYQWSPASGQPEGYLSYRFERPPGATERTLVLREFVALTDGAWRGLLGFLAGHDAQAREILWPHAPVEDPLRFYLENPRIQVQLMPRFSFRIVDVQGALAVLSYPVNVRATLSLKIADPTAPWNDGIFQVEFNQGQARVKRAAGEPDLSLDIQAFSQIFDGFLSARQLATLGRLTARDRRVLPLVDSLFGGRIPYISDVDYF
ncbi:MAG: GNAT family N-acetyltransferase [Firmicutes bacterium]|nr:GNAT family N-acetyltransferase [Bacillota bacterium]